MKKNHYLYIWFFTEFYDSFKKLKVFSFWNEIKIEKKTKDLILIHKTQKCKRVEVKFSLFNFLIFLRRMCKIKNKI